MTNEIIRVEGLYKIFGAHAERALAYLQHDNPDNRFLLSQGWSVALHNVSLTVKQGEIFVIVGLSGSGKSTLLRTLNRLITPTAGEVFFKHNALSSLTEKALITLRRHAVNMVFQSFALLPTRTVLDNVAFGLEVAGMTTALRHRQALAILEQVGLADQAHRLPHQLSGGMQQRVGLARALVVNPELMLMDEAFSALDPINRRDMQQLLLRLQAEQQRTIVFVTHDIEEALRLGNRIAIMEQGRLIQVGSAEALINAPANAYVRRFFASIDTSRYVLAESLASPWEKSHG